MDEFYSKTVYEAAVHTFGKESQKLIAIEEMSELIKALSKDTRYPNDPEVLDNVAEEIADVLIMLDQLKLIFQCSDAVREHKRKKTKRLANLINQTAK